MIFRTERQLVETYVQTVDSARWQVYPETGNFDLLLSRKEDGFQIGIEAKLKLNTKVICQAADLAIGRSLGVGPDCRAVLVPHGQERNEYGPLLKALQIVVLRVSGRSHAPWVTPGLPAAPEARGEWPEHFPAQRLELPDYVPDVAAGVASPTKLTLWKIKAIKISLILKKRGYLVRRDFARFDISPSVWTQRGWIVASDSRGRWIEGVGIPDFEKQHPINYAQIEADYMKWNSRDLEGII